MPLIAYLHQGMMPEKLALAVALGAVLGTTTIICTTLALILELNLPAILLVNLFVYPLQLIFLIPFLKIGSSLIGGPEITLTLHELMEQAGRNIWEMIHTLWLANLFGLMIWTLIAVPAGVIIYYLSRTLFRRIPLNKDLNLSSLNHRDY